MKNKLTLIVNSSASRNKNKSKPVLVGEVKNSNVINVAFSNSSMLRGLYSYECELSSKALALLYVIWFGKEGNLKLSASAKRRKFAKYVENFIHRG